MQPLTIILGCEESQAVCIEFRKRGHNAFSCDLKPCSGGHPEWHFQMDVFKAIAGGMLVTQSGELVEIKKWDRGIFFPTCTYLTLSANTWYEDQPPLKSGALVGAARREARRKAIEFFMALANCNIPKTAIENPLGVMSTEWRKPDQIIQPYYFGDEARKPTCLWLKNLPKLYHTKTQTLFDSPTHVSQGESLEWIDKKTGKKKRQPKWYAMAKQGSSLEIRSGIRSKTFNGIAEAMANQWG